MNLHKAAIEVVVLCYKGTKMYARTETLLVAVFSAISSASDRTADISATLNKSLDPFRTRPPALPDRV